MAAVTEETLAMTALLRDELARNEPRRKLVDPRTVPLRFHHLKAMGRSAAHCYESMQSDGSGSNLAQRLGSGTHALLMGQDVAVFDVPAKKGKGRAPRNGEVWEEFKAEHTSAVILSRKEHDEAIRMATAIRSNPEAAEWLTSPGIVYEQTILWEQSGRARRSTPDMRCPKRITEVKTTRSAAPGQFRWDVKRFSYHAQLVDQRNAARAAGLPVPMELCIIAVEKTRPYVVQTYRLTSRDIELAEQILGSWFNAYRVAEDSNAWDGYAFGTLDLDVPDDSDDGEIEFSGAADEDDAELTDAESPL